MAAAPASDPQALAMLTAADVGEWLAQAQTLVLTDATSQRGVLFLGATVSLRLTPKETALLPNFPNPFNPETWMPYQLAEDSNVTLIIRSSHGQPVRRLTAGAPGCGDLITAAAAPLIGTAETPPVNRLRAGSTFTRSQQAISTQRGKMLIRK